VVTNDQMRDHHFCMLAPRFFLKWRERHQVRMSALSA
jgi:ribonuclease P protein 3